MKCKSIDPADVNIYRPIESATALSKVLEQIVLSRRARYLWTADSQYGFKRAHGTEMAIFALLFALKQTVDFYHNQDTPVYMCFFDAKKAFDRVKLDAGKETVRQKCASAYCKIVYLLV